MDAKGGRSRRDSKYQFSDTSVTTVASVRAFPHLRHVFAALSGQKRKTRTEATVVTEVFREFFRVCFVLFEGIWRGMARACPKITGGRPRHDEQPPDDIGALGVEENQMIRFFRRLMVAWASRP
jgi:hypothetical protein